MEGIPHWNPDSRIFSYKNLSYAHEREVRIIVDRYSVDPSSDEVQAGIIVRVDLKKLLNRFVLPPAAPAWFVDAVEWMLNRAGLSVPLSRSALSLPPI